MIAHQPRPTEIRLKLNLLPEERHAVRALLTRLGDHAPAETRTWLGQLSAGLSGTNPGSEVTLSVVRITWLACYLEAIVPCLSKGTHQARAAEYLCGALKHNLAFKGRVHFRFFTPHVPRVIIPRGPNYRSSHHGS